MRVGVNVDFCDKTLDGDITVVGRHRLLIAIFTVVEVRTHGKGRQVAMSFEKGGVLAG